jgi:CDP-diacylglycerol--serine O-phosphatidyltransferase
MIKHFLNPPNWFTSASIFCSVYAMALVMQGGADPAVLSRASVLVVFGGIFDMLDGRVARMTNRFTEFGVQLDSIADVLGFGLAPAMLAWTWKLHELGGFGVAITFWYVLCAAFRLARFNVEASNKSWTLDGHTQGLTTTMSGGALVTGIWVANDYLLDALTPSAFWVGALVAGLGVAMISSIPFRSFKDTRQNKKARAMLAVCLAACLAGAIVLDWSMWWGVGAFLYLTVGLVDGIVTAIWHRRLTNALLIDEMEQVLQEDGLPDEQDVDELEAR